MTRAALALLLALLAGGARAQEGSAREGSAQGATPVPPGRAGGGLVIPQAEGARQGRVLGRALACGLPRERADAAIRTRRERMLAAVGRAFTEDRYLPELDRALGFETGLPRPSEAACARALEAFAALEREP